MSSPIYNPPVPYTGPIPSGFLPGRMVRIQGRVNSSANSLAINLRTGPNPYDDVALHVNPRFNESVIVRNSCMQSSWGAEERHGPALPIYRDQNFEILILSEASAFKIAVNGQHFSEFVHRLQPLDRINYLNVEGDLTISLIQFDGTATQTSSYAASAPPMGYGAGGGTPYPPSSALPTTGFVMPGTGGAPPPPMGGSPYPPAAGGAYPPAQPYGGYPSQPPPPAAAAGGYYNPGGQQPGGGYPPQGPPPGGAYPGQGQPGGYYNPGGHAPGGPPHGGSSGGGGLLSDASKLLAGGLAGVGLAKVANKIPGLGGGGHHGGHYGGGGYPGGGHHGGGGSGPLGALGGMLGTAGALGVGGMVANKAMKKNKKSNMMKYGLPVGGAVLGGYALKKGMKGFGHHGGSSSSSSSSEEE